MIEIRRPGGSRGPECILRLKTWIPAFAGMTMLFCFSGAFAGPSVAIRTEAGPRDIYIGDPIAMTVTVTASNDVAFKPIRLSTSMGNFELLAFSTPTVVSKDGKNTFTTRFLLSTFSTGPATIPALTLQFATVDGSSSTAKTEEISINVRSLLAEKGDEGNIRPLKGLFNFKSYLWIWILIGLIAAAVLGYFLWTWMELRRYGPGGAPAGPPRPPEELAWEAIHALEDKDLIGTGQAKEFYFQLSMILREYLERRYGFSALDRTTSELLNEFRRNNLPLTLTSLLREFLDNGDLVKFAKFTPNAEEVTADLNHVKQFVNLSTPQKVTAPKEEKIPV